ncbi:class I SAM-dependent methyltransferase [Dongia rigui]|uniref:Class I SAM-dependent methyltransferase n=1 Tax=Dongia rigui TaxID=940149 RepID=A0ABU5DYL5_9PROT|nr:class I SAM-dependent methyltransferase [Dongia rigui]MDY0872323.1 class I SAM-dependent methyltransferase [Dongia rigui]
MPTGFWRHFSLGLATLCGARRRGFFIPYRYADQVTPPTVYAAAQSLFDAARGDFAALLSALAPYAADLGAIAPDAPAPAPRWGQDWFAPMDAAILYALIRDRRPACFLEVGSGHSTRFAARAIGDGKLATRHVAIDPAPRADVGTSALTLHRCVLKDADPALFAGLRAGDMLFIDSSHILMPGTDVDQLFNGVLPALPKGVLVHIHDIFLPDDYPMDWAWRGYNEQLAVLPLLGGGGFKPLFASRYAETRMKAETAASLIAQLPSSKAPATSLWLEKV